MSTDLQLELQSDGQTYDLVIGDNGDFVGDTGLSTTILTSILSDARASASEVADPIQRGGWFGNLVFPREDSELGSLLWIIRQRRRTTASLNVAVDRVQKGLAWFLEDGIAKNIDVTGSLDPTGATINIEVTPFSGETSNLYVPLWKETP